MKSLEEIYKITVRFREKKPRVLFMMLVFFIIMLRIRKLLLHHKWNDIR